MRGAENPGKKHVFRFFPRVWSDRGRSAVTAWCHFPRVWSDRGGDFRKRKTRRRGPLVGSDAVFFVGGTQNAASVIPCGFIFRLPVTFPLYVTVIVFSYIKKRRRKDGKSLRGFDE